jgi:hypothetical protein
LINAAGFKRWAKATLNPTMDLNVEFAATGARDGQQVVRARHGGQESSISGSCRAAEPADHCVVPQIAKPSGVPPEKVNGLPEIGVSAPVTASRVYAEMTLLTLEVAPSVA